MSPSPYERQTSRRTWVATHFAFAGSKRGRHGRRASQRADVYDPKEPLQLKYSVAGAPRNGGALGRDGRLEREAARPK